MDGSWGPGFRSYVTRTLGSVAIPARRVPYDVGHGFSEPQPEQGCSGWHWRHWSHTKWLIFIVMLTLLMLGQYSLFTWNNNLPPGRVEFDASSSPPPIESDSTSCNELSTELDEYSYDSDESSGSLPSLTRELNPLRQAKKGLPLGDIYWKFVTGVCSTLRS